MADLFKFVLFLFLSGLSLFNAEDSGASDENKMQVEHSTSDFVFWPNATIPFYIDPEHYDHEQSLSIMTSLSLLSFKTCLKFAPVASRPRDADHVLMVENPKGLRKCTLNTDGHSIDEPHKIVLGYDCLKSPDIDMMIMNALGFPFEHNRAIRDVYIDVQQENVEPGFMELFTMESKLPIELRLLPYDVHSVMHFDERAFSKNGHRTIIFKDHKTKQNRAGLSDIDLRKIEIVYGPECLKRDRQEKVELCQYYPGVARRKREVEQPDINQNLRVNRDITPPPEIKLSEDLTQNLKDLGIESEVQEIVDQVNKVSAHALKNARIKYCNLTKPDLRTDEEKTATDILGIVESVAEYAKVMVDNAVSNLTTFCEVSQSLSTYERQKGGCPFFNGARCPVNYRSTKSGPVKYSTQHRPLIRQSTKHKGSYNAKKGQYDSQYHMRAKEDNSTNITVVVEARRKRAIHPLAIDKTSGRDAGFTQEEFYRRKRHSALRETVEEVNRWKRDVGKEETVTTVTSTANTEGRKIASASGLPSVSEALINTDVTSAPIAEKTETVTFAHEKTFPSKADLRLRNTKKPVVKTVDYAPTDRRRRFRPKTLKTKAKKEEKKNWDDSKMSMERQKPRQGKVVLSDEEDDDAVNKGDNDDDETINSKKHDSGSSSETKKESVLEFVPETVALNKLNREFYRDRRWPENEVPYIIMEDGTFDAEDVRSRLSEVNAILRDKTCVKIKEIRESEANKYEDYLVLDSSPDYVTGKVGGRQLFGVVELLRGGQHRQHAAMMVMAMLGFYFEVSRHDRDKYIRVHQRHVRADKLHHFEKIRSDATLDLPYDYRSATHPAWQFWRHIGRTGISTVATYKEQDPDGSLMKSLGQHEELLSNTDLIKINSVYGVKCFKSSRRATLRRRPSRRKF